jgi:hypothetical protein
MMKIAKVGILFDERAAQRKWRYGINCFGRYLGEIMAHAGMTYHWIRDIRDLNRRKTDLVLVAEAEDSEQTSAALWEFARQGGAVVSYAGLRSMAAALGCLPATPIGVGYAAANDPAGRPEPLRFLRAEPWQAAGADVGAEAGGLLLIGRPDGESAGKLLHRFRVGEGFVERWAVDVPHTIVHLQQGLAPVLRDGIPAPDGTGNVIEGILKGDDELAFDWETDRKATPTGGMYFALPHADLWRELLLRRLIRTASSMGLTLPFIGLWPEGVRHVAAISHDSDNNQDEHAESALKLLAEQGIHSTWCMLEPGYSTAVYDKVKQAGHELAFHYNALDAQGGKWEQQEFERQLEWLRSVIDTREVTSNKNHYTRFEGWGELFAWCEANGVRVDQTRGPSKKGNVGFLFGTCHPFAPISWFDEGNRFYDMMEIGFLTQDMDLGNWADSSVIVPFLEEVVKVEGIAHFLFHQVHIHKEEPVREAFRTLVREARSRGFEFWLTRDIYAWEKARRNAQITGVNARGEVVVTDAPEGAFVWVPVLDAKPGTSGVELKYGVPCRRQALSVEGQMIIDSDKPDQIAMGE